MGGKEKAKYTDDVIRRKKRAREREREKACKRRPEGKKRNKTRAPRPNKQFLSLYTRARARGKAFSYRRYRNLHSLSLILALGPLHTQIHILAVLYTAAEAAAGRKPLSRANKRLDPFPSLSLSLLLFVLSFIQSSFTPSRFLLFDECTTLLWLYFERRSFCYWARTTTSRGSSDSWLNIFIPFFSLERERESSTLDFFLFFSYCSRIRCCSSSSSTSYARAAESNEGLPSARSFFSPVNGLFKDLLSRAAIQFQINVLYIFEATLCAPLSLSTYLSLLHCAEKQMSRLCCCDKCSYFCTRFF